jgi:hypothetical protein
MLGIKRCTRCKTIKSKEDFGKDRSAKDGQACWCKECYSSVQKKDYRENKEKYKKYAEGQRDYQRKYAKEFYENNKDSVSVRSKLKIDEAILSEVKP